MIVQSDSGLCNRLRVMFSYWKHCDHLEVVWRVNSKCNGHFLDHFCQVPGIRFVDAPSGQVSYYGCHANGEPDYTHLKPLSEVMDQVANNVGQLGASFLAVHVRRTDHVRLAKKRRNFTADEAFFRFLDDRQENIFVACDCVATQNQFKSRYGNRMPVLSPFEFAKSRRKSTLRQAVVDLFTCVQAAEFLGSGWSSFSQLIQQQRTHRIDNDSGARKRDGF